MQVSGWMTIPEWASVRQNNVYAREQKAQVLPEKGAPENLHVLVRGTFQLPLEEVQGSSFPAEEAEVREEAEKEIAGDYELLVAADDHYQLWIDGVYQGQGPAASYPECCYYDRYPIPSEEQVVSSSGGMRIVTVALHLYYHGRISRSFTSGDGRFGLWALVRQKGASGRELARADENWRYLICGAYRGETVGYDTQFLENFDSRRWPEGWERPGFAVDADTKGAEQGERPDDLVRTDDAGNNGTWGYLIPALWADYRMLPRPIKALTEKKAVPVKYWEEREIASDICRQDAAEQVKLPDGWQKGDCYRVVLDFGREITGGIVAEASGPAGAQIVIRCGEELEETVRPAEGPAADSVPHVRWEMRCGCAYQESWTLGTGVSYLHPYDYKGFRYAELLYPPEVKLRQVYAWVRHYPMEEKLCTLVCGKRMANDTRLRANDGAAENDEVLQERNHAAKNVELWASDSAGELEQIFEICKNAVRCCSQDGYLDCPTREKGQYLGDAIITGRAQVWLTGSTELLRKCIADFMASSMISPSLMAVAPGSVMQEIADFSLLFPMLPLTDYEFTGDQTYLARCYPAVHALTESFLIYQREDGLLENVSALWNLVDWPENLRDGYDFSLTRPIVGKGCHNVINALWYGANQMQEEIERLLDLPVTGRSAQIGDSFRRVFYREKQRLFADSETSGHCSLHANLYAAYFGLLPKESEEAYIQMIQTPGRVCGVMPAYFLLKSLARMGRPEVCFERMMRSDAYGWRNMVREGASAAFEAWGKEQKWNTSLCHGWGSGFLSLFIEEIAGLHPDPAKPEGYRLEACEIAGCPEFELRVPWKTGALRIRSDFSLP